MQGKDQGQRKRAISLGASSKDNPISDLVREGVLLSEGASINKSRLKAFAQNFSDKLNTSPESDRKLLLDQLKQYVNKENLVLFSAICGEFDYRMYDEIILRNKYDTLAQCYKSKDIAESVLSSLGKLTNIPDIEAKKAGLIERFVFQFIQDYAGWNRIVDYKDVQADETKILEFLRFSIDQIGVGKVVEIVSGNLELSMRYTKIDKFLFGLISEQEKLKLVKSSIEKLLPTRGARALAYLSSLWPENHYLVMRNIDTIKKALLSTEDKSSVFRVVANIIQNELLSPKDRVEALYGSFDRLGTEEVKELQKLFKEGDKETLPKYVATIFMENGFFANAPSIYLHSHLNFDMKALMQTIPTKGMIANDYRVFPRLSKAGDVYTKILESITMEMSRRFFLYYRDCMESFSFFFKDNPSSCAHTSVIENISSGRFTSIYARFLILLAGSTTYGEGVQIITKYEVSAFFSKEKTGTDQEVINCLHKNLCSQLPDLLKDYDRPGQIKIYTALEQGIDYISGTLNKRKQTQQTKDWLLVLGKLKKYIREINPQTSIPSLADLALSVMLKGTSRKATVFSREDELAMLRKSANLGNHLHKEVIVNTLTDNPIYLPTTALGGRPDMVSYNLLKEKWLAQHYEVSEFSRINFLPLLSFSAIIYDNADQSSKTEIMNFAHELFLLEFGQAEILVDNVPELSKALGLKVGCKIIDFCHHVIRDIQGKYPDKYDNYLRNIELNHIRAIFDKVKNEIIAPKNDKSSSSATGIPSGENVVEMEAMDRKANIDLGMHGK